MDKIKYKNFICTCIMYFIHILWYILSRNNKSDRKWNEKGTSISIFIIQAIYYYLLQQPADNYWFIQTINIFMTHLFGKFIPEVKTNRKIRYIEMLIEAYVMSKLNLRWNETRNATVARVAEKRIIFAVFVSFHLTQT